MDQLSERQLSDGGWRSPAELWRRLNHTWSARKRWNGRFFCCLDGMNAREHAFRTGAPIGHALGELPPKPDVKRGRS
jgi:hypothetical protein